MREGAGPWFQRGWFFETTRKCSPCHTRFLRGRDSRSSRGVFPDHGKESNPRHGISGRSIAPVGEVSRCGAFRGFRAKARGSATSGIAERRITRHGFRDPTRIHHERIHKTRACRLRLARGSRGSSESRISGVRTRSRARMGSMANL